MPDRPPKLVIRWTATVILVALAAFYTVLVFQYDYNLWEGPNFGMFATAEGPETRIIRCMLLTEERETPVECPDELLPSMLRAKGTPTQANLDELAGALAQQMQRQPLGSPVTRSVRVELWQFSYHADQSEAAFEQRLAAEAQVEGGER